MRLQRMAEGLTGTTIGPYRLDEELGRGGMGIVYRAKDLALRRPVAVKVLAPEFVDDRNARARFQREIESAVAIEHPHVVPVYSAGYEDGSFFLAMRCIDGPDLGRLVDDGGPLPEARALRLVGQIASALYAVHERGLVHRDIKPQNVLVWNAGAPDEHVFLTDFGLARALEETNPITKFGVLGTPGYMAPELHEGRQPTPACDQYALACVAYEVMTGSLPRAERLAEAIQADSSGAISRRTLETIHRALAFEPSERFPDVRAFVMTNTVSNEAFDRSRAISRTIERRSGQDLVHELTQHGLTDEVIAEISDLRKSQVVRMQRQAARKALVGDWPQKQDE